MLLHAQRLWPEAISSILWPFAMKYANHLHNFMSLNNKGLSPFERFTSTSVMNDLDISDFHTFGYHAMSITLSNTYQSGNLDLHWEFLLVFRPTMQEMWLWFLTHIRDWCPLNIMLFLMTIFKLFHHLIPQLSPNFGQPFVNKI